MLLYCNTITPRLQYIVDFFNKELFEEPIIITADSSQFEQAVGPKLNYSSQEFIGTALAFTPWGYYLKAVYGHKLSIALHANGHAAFFQRAAIFPLIFLLPLFTC